LVLFLESVGIVKATIESIRPEIVETVLSETVGTDVAARIGNS